MRPIMALISRRLRTCILAVILSASVNARAAEVEVCLTPGQNCTDWIVEILATARQSLLIQQYELTSPDLIRALVAAHARGVVVKVVLDRRISRYSGAADLVHNGIPVVVDTSVSGIAHNKIAILDGASVIDGSFNWSVSAQRRNAENVLFIRDRALATRLTANFEAHEARSVPYHAARHTTPARQSSHHRRRNHTAW
jgi:phosphatidylserine/phosphatidylglycerophosphate/cardiolipin synthase-like enzyme